MPKSGAGGSGPITFVSSGNLILKDCEPADGLRPAAVDGGVILSAKKKQAGITYMLTATEATVKNARAMSGAWVSMSKPLGENARCASIEGEQKTRRSGDSACFARAAATPVGAPRASCARTWRDHRTPSHTPRREDRNGRPELWAAKEMKGSAPAKPVCGASPCDQGRHPSPPFSPSHFPPPGDFTTGTITYDLAGRAAAAAVLNSIKLAGGRALDVGARWAEKGNAFSLELGGKPHPAHRLFASVNPATRAAVGSWTADIAGLTLQAARNFAKGSDQLSVGRTLAGGLKAVASFAPQDAVASLALGKAPLRASVRAKRLPGGGFGKPTISLGVDRDFQVEALRRSRAIGSAGAPAAAAVVDSGLSLSRVADGARNWFGRSEAGPRVVQGIKVETYSVA